MTQDPFSDPIDIPSEHPNAASFRGRLILIEPTRLELDLPKQEGGVQDKVTATVTVVDGLGDVELCPSQIPSGVKVPGPVYEGVWFSQERIVKGLFPTRVFTPGKRVLTKLDTYKGGPAKKGNPWGMATATPAEKQAAVKFLAELTINGASAPAEEEPPF